MRHVLPKELYKKQKLFYTRIIQKARQRQRELVMDQSKKALCSSDSEANDEVGGEDQDEDEDEDEHEDEHEPEVKHEDPKS